MSVPKAVQRAADEVAQIEQAIAAEIAQPEPDLSNAIEPQPAEAPTNPEPPQPQPAAPEPAPQPPSKPPVDWEAKYKTLQGMYNAHVPKLQQQLRELSDRVAAQEKATKPEPAKPQKPSADPKDVEAFGADLVDMVGRVAERMFGDVATQFDERIARIEAQLNSTGQAVSQTAEQAFFAQLDQLVPDWEILNADERVLAWLAEVDPVYGHPRQAALESARSALDARRAAAVFNAARTAIAPPPAPPAPPKPSLSNQVAPTANAAAPMPTAVSKPIITQKQIEVFFNDLAHGKYRGREAQAQAIEAEINQALAEGRVR